jgi:glyoxylase-like metal-dependent hydrolase (beta-lactamase superfamily II)
MATGVKMANWKDYTLGVHQIADDVWAYLQPDGSWGWNNTALLISEGESLLVDTTIDLTTTQRMLAEMRSICHLASVDSVFLTHWHVDHVHGISAPELMHSEIIASQVCADYLAKLPPAAWLAAIAGLEDDAKKQMAHLLNDQFDFSGLRYVQPTRTFERELTIEVGNKKVQAIEAKPCHTRSDTIVHIPHAGVVHMGDLVRARHHIGLQFPSMQNLMDICQKAISLNAKTYITGHGPLMDHSDMVAAMQYLHFIQDRAKKSHDAGRSLHEAFDDLLKNLGPYSHYTGLEGLFFTTRMMYAEFSGDFQDHARKDYPAYLAMQWKLRSTLRDRYPELFRK